MFLVRELLPTDLDDLQRTATYLDSVNLPDDRALLAELIERSRRSFAGELPVADRCFVLALVDCERGEVVGTSMIFAQHGSRRAPHVFFDVIEEQRYSETLDRHFAHRLLRIGYNYDGLTEIGGLVLRPPYRRHPEQLGRLLSYVRFLYIGLHRRLFCDEVLSELMPPLEPDGTSLLWEWLGRKFTGLSYQEADRLSQQNKEFIRALFPQDPLYATLLPRHVQDLIGQVGPETKGVEKMLREIGFSYAQRIDPFDGGPHFHADTDQIALVKAVARARIAAAAPAPAPAAPPAPPASASGAVGPMLVARERDRAPAFLAVRVLAPPPGIDGTLALPPDVLRRLEAAPGDEVAYLPLSIQS
jgi:arginine N-succinyltransferase